MAGLTGLICPNLTPFNNDLSIAMDLYIEHAKRMLDAGCSALAPFGTTGEALSVGMDERMEVLEASIAENMTLATLPRFTHHGLLDHPSREAQVKAQFDALRIKAPGTFAIVNQLSGGNQQKVVLGKWLMSNPRVLFLDEPTRGIDVGAKSEIYQLIAALAERGLGVVLVSSDLPELLGMSHRVLVLSLGRATADLAADGASPETVMAAATMKV